MKFTIFFNWLINTFSPRLVDTPPYKKQLSEYKRWSTTRRLSFLSPLSKAGGKKMATVFIRISAQPRISAHPPSIKCTRVVSIIIYSLAYALWIHGLRECWNFPQSFAFCYYHLLFCCKINILHLLKMVKI